MRPTIKSITYIGENRPSKRVLKFKLSNGAVIKAEGCHESWEQYGGTQEELYVTMPVVERHNDWLHGGERP
jgi:hypothetical protein